MKILPMATNRVLIVTENGDTYDLNDGGTTGLLVKPAKFEDKNMNVEQDGYRILLTLEDK